MLAGRPFDIFDDLLAGAFACSCCLSHLPLLSGYDEPTTLSYQIPLFGPISADVRQFRTYDQQLIPAAGDRIVQSWDTASKASEANDWSVCTTWRVPKEDKATRLLSVSHLIEGGQIAVPENAPWIAEFQREVTLFPNGKHDDQVDSMTQFLRWLAEPQVMPRIRAL
jgi:phage terminase large subunit-like protein